MNLRLKLTVEAKTLNSNFELESIMKAKFIVPENNQTYQNQFYTYKIIFFSFKSRTAYRHTKNKIKP
jgi:hypothetical protein